MPSETPHQLSQHRERLRGDSVDEEESFCCKLSETFNLFLVDLVDLHFSL
jgi:hypothetical protein